MSIPLILPPGAKQLATKIRKLRARPCQDIVEIGRLLVEAKAAIGHGSWSEWLRAEFAWSQDTAENYVRVFYNFKDAKSETFRNLDSSSLYELSRSSTPQEARETVATLIEEGSHPTFAGIVQSDELEMLANFFRQIAANDRRAA